MDAAGCCLMGPGLRWLSVEPCGAPGLVLTPCWAESGSWRFCGCCSATARRNQVLGIMLDYWQAELVSGVRDHRAHFRLLLVVSDGSWQFGVCSMVFWILHWPASALGPCLAGPRVGSVLLWVGWFLRWWDHSFVASYICSLVSETGLVSNTGF